MLPLKNNDNLQAQGYPLERLLIRGNQELTSIVGGETLKEAMELSPERSIKCECDTDFRVDYKLREDYQPTLKKLLSLSKG